MTYDQLSEYCLSKKGATEEYPFGDETPVFKAGGKIFAIAGFGEGLEVNLKCDPERAVELRERYEDIRPGYHMNKKHWNTVNFRGSIPDKILKELIDHSYEVVIAGLSKKKRSEL